MQLAVSPSKEVHAAMVASSRVRQEPSLLRALAANKAITLELKTRLEALLPDRPPSTEEGDVLEIESEISRYVAEHAAEIAAEAAKAYELTDLTEDEKRELKHGGHGEQKDAKRQSPLQKIAAMEVAERVQLAMKGNREERFILIRDGCKVVSSA